MQPKLEKRGTCTYTREEHRAILTRPRGRTTLARLCIQAGPPMPTFTTLSFSHVGSTLNNAYPAKQKINTRDNTNVPLSL